MKAKPLVYLCALACVCGACKKDEPALSNSPVQAIYFDQESYLLDQGEHLSLYGKLTIEPTAVADTATVTWRSSEENIATVSEYGTLKAKAKGEVVVTATACGKSATCIVNVRAVFDMTPDTLSLVAWKSSYGVQTNRPKNEVKWQTSNSAVAEVSDEGVVTARKAGQALIIGQWNQYKDTSVVNVYAEYGVVCNERIVKTMALRTNDTIRLSTPTITESIWDESELYGILAHVGNHIYVAKKAGKAAITVLLGEDVAHVIIWVNDYALKMGDEFVEFAPSNLRYNPSFGYFDFADYAYQMIGDRNTQRAEDDYSGLTDLFAYGTGSKPLSSQAKTTFVDWGKNEISYLSDVYAPDTWHTPSKEEIQMILETDYTQYSMHGAKGKSINTCDAWKECTVNGTEGMVMYAVDAQLPEWFERTVSFSSSQWQTLLKLGVVFFPKAGELTYSNSSGTYYYTDNPTHKGYYYWLSDQKKSSGGYQVLRIVPGQAGDNIQPFEDDIDVNTLLPVRLIRKLK
ncbi:MAG: Ig-like domain-containing protein [Paludibacteraceae bacterium]|nr:Ig-like domain-containing protein [Paludibacteraceae bacterium]